ncbi:MAG: DNA-binding response regulator ChvI [Deltaproteobacteria bacterium]|nr:DNA-binding response regulator ChvI [Deltaproteobacteria bacterium]
MRLLLIDDDADLLDGLRVVLGAEGHVITALTAGRPAVALLQAERFDAIVCDVNLPDLDGFAICRQLRARGDTTPLVLLTSRDGDIDEALGLELGADDYMTKPFSTRVLLARLGALARRAAPALQDDLVRAGELEIDRERLSIRYRHIAIPATLTELRLLVALAERPGRVLAREVLLERAREDDSFVAPRLVDTYIARLRKKLDEIEPGAGAQIETVTGAGYRWRESGSESGRT